MIITLIFWRPIFFITIHISRSTDNLNLCCAFNFNLAISHYKETLKKIMLQVSNNTHVQNISLWSAGLL